MKLSLIFAGFSLLGTACSSSSSPGSPVGDGGGEAGSTNEAGVTVEAGSDGAALVDSPSGDASQGSPGDAGGDAADGAVACNALANTATPVTGSQAAENPPALQGGAVVNGTYFLTNLTIYTGPDGPTGSTGMSQTTIQISGDTIQVATNGTPGTRTEMFTVAAGGTFSATDTCPDTSVVQGAYSATATTFVVQFPGGSDDAGARTVQETFTKQ
jgi:hypothetical protein